MATNKLTRPNSSISDTEDSFYRKRRSFASGLTLEERKEVLLWTTISGGDGNYYQWMGTLPKVVPVNSTPANSGGIATDSWISVGNANYLEKITTDFGTLSGRVDTLEQNPTGKSAYQSYVDTTTDNPVLTESEWVASLHGVTGSGLVIKGSFGSIDDLPATGNSAGDAYIIQSQMWVWDSIQWSPVGQIGPDGLSAYQVWLQAGNTGSVLDYLESIKGDKGDPGPTGATGPQGENASSVIFQGTLTDVANLPTATSDNLNWYYIIGTEGYVSNGSSWVDIGNIQGPVGATGLTGETGPQGVRGLQGEQGPQGPQGPQGVAGENAAALNFKGSVATEADLPATGNTISDAYVVGTNIWAWTGTEWENLGNIQGPQGPQGEQGPQGPQGATGPAGATGATGAAGTNGTNGVDGQDGADGEDGHSVLAKGEVASVADLPSSGNNNADMYYVDGNTYIWNGTAWIDMGTNLGPAGPQGDPGPQGVAGTDGAAGSQGPAGPTGATGPQGPQGDIGPGVTILGSLASTADLPTTGTTGQGYLIGDDFYVWTGSAYENVGPIRGPEGPQGAQGPTGEQGVQGTTGAKGDQGSLWIVLARTPTAVDGRVGDYYIDSTTNIYYQKTSATNWAQMGTLGGGNVYDAPADGIYYVRRNQAWEATPIAEAPINGNQYVRQDGSWSTISFPTPAVAEAPTDGQQYVRKNAAWAAFALPTNAVTEAPTTAGNYYIRTASSWKRLDRYDLNITAQTTTLDVSLAQVFTVDLSSARTLTLTNLPAGRAMPIVILFSGNAGGVTWGNTISWSDSTAPTYSNTRTVITLIWDGSTLIGLKPGGY